MDESSGSRDGQTGAAGDRITPVSYITRSQNIAHCRKKNNLENNTQRRTCRLSRKSFPRFATFTGKHNDFFLATLTTTLQNFVQFYIQLNITLTD